jgi:hypothetical protein
MRHRVADLCATFKLDCIDNHKTNVSLQLLLVTTFANMLLGALLMFKSQNLLNQISNCKFI